MEYEYYICDVFTDQRFGGNQLAVLPDAAGLDTETMQKIANEFNLSETTFVFFSENGHTRNVRIFTPSTEVPFAGHPNVGTAHILAEIGEIVAIAGDTDIIFEEKAGLVPIRIHRDDDGIISCELEAPSKPTIGEALPVEQIASALSLEEDAIKTDVHSPVVTSVGLPFIIAELKDRSALERCRTRLDVFDAIKAQHKIMPDIYVYLRSGDEFDIRGRMFAPLDGVPEDPATGSANCALAGLLAAKDGAESGDYSWRIAQGVEMGRPSVLNARARKQNRFVTNTWIGGRSVYVGKGTIRLD